MKKYLLLTAIVAAVSLIFGAATSTAFSPDSRVNRRLVEWMICEPGQTVDYEESAPYTITDQEGTRRVANISIDCVAPDGTRFGGKEGRTIGVLMGVYSLFFFVPLLVAGIIWLRRMLKASQNASL